MKLRVPHLAATLLILAGCQDEPPTPGREVPFSGVCDKGNERQRVAVTGYLRLPSSFKRNDAYASLRLYEQPRFTGRPIRVGAKFGGRPNEVAQPGNPYGDQHLRVRLAGGGEATLGTRVKVSGEMYFPLVPQTGDEAFDCGLSNPLVELAPETAAAAAR